MREGSPGKISFYGVRHEMRRGSILLQSERALAQRRHYYVVLPFVLAACLSLAPELSNTYAGFQQQNCFPGELIEQ